MWQWFKRNDSKRSNGQNGNIHRKLKSITRVLHLNQVSSNEIAMIQNIIELESLIARDIMIPRIDVQTLNINAKKSELIKLVTDKHVNSRIPVYEENIDNVKGILHVKDLFFLFINKNKKLEFSKYLSDPYFVPESKKIIEILEDFQTQRTHLAIVVDEYGGFSGILTLEDIIEEIIGDVQDEFDNENEEIKKLDEHIYSIDARTDLETLNDYFHLELPVEEADTIGGLFINTLGYIPKLNQSIRYEQFEFKVIKKRRNSLVRIRMRFLKSKPKSNSLL